MSSENDKITNNFIVENLKKIFNDKLITILDEISNDYNINNEKLKTKYVDNSFDFSTMKKRKRKQNKLLAKCELCMARKADGLQCTRRRKDDTEFCGKHASNLKYGRVDDEERNNTNQIKCTLEKINGNSYLVDCVTKLVYTFDTENPTVVGKMEENGTVVFHKS